MGHLFHQGLLSQALGLRGAGVGVTARHHPKPGNPTTPSPQDTLPSVPPCIVHRPRGVSAAGSVWLLEVPARFG
jgi:hypothetical protein